MRFFVPPFFPIIPVRGPYWVIAICDEYKWAVVGQPERKRGWILSRTPKIEVRRPVRSFPVRRPDGLPSAMPARRRGGLTGL